MGKKEAQSIGLSISKNDSRVGSKGDDSGKKIKGRKRHIIVDTLGLIVTAEVHSAGVQDRNGALDLLIKAKQKKHQLREIFC